MGEEELNGEYQRLRDELDAAYSGAVWNSARIDRIAEQIMQVEFALGSTQSADAQALLPSTEPPPHTERDA